MRLWSQLYPLAESESMASLSDQAFRLFIHIISEADDHGRMLADPDQIRIRALGITCAERPDWTVAQVGVCLDLLHRLGLGVFYLEDSKRVLQVANWNRYQVARNGRRENSKLPKITKNSRRLQPDISRIEFGFDLDSFWIDLGFDSDLRRILFGSPVRQRQRQRQRVSKDTLGDASAAKVGAKKTVIPYEKIRELYNATCAKAGMPEAAELSKSRKTHIKARWTDHPDLEWWSELFERAAESDFLTGRRVPDGSSFVADLGWLVKNDDNPIKVRAGNYDNRTRQSNGGVADVY